MRASFRGQNTGLIVETLQQCLPASCDLISLLHRVHGRQRVVEVSQNQLGGRDVSFRVETGGPRFRLSGLILTSATSGTAIIKTETGTVRLRLRKTEPAPSLRVPASQPLTSPGESSAPAPLITEQAEPARGPARLPDVGANVTDRRPGLLSPTALPDLDLSSSFSDGDSIFRVLDFRRGMILLEELPQRRLINRALVRTSAQLSPSNRLLPTRIKVAPSSIATWKSRLIPMESSGSMFPSWD